MQDQFQKNLENKSQLEFRELKKDLTDGIRKVFKNHGLGVRMGLEIKVYTDTAGFTLEEDRKTIMAELEAKNLSQFQEALSDFAWAVENQR